MDFPERTKQKKAESESYAILLYKLRKVGIFRNLTESDYGIDFEIEPVSGNSVTGKYIKAQVKAAENVFVRDSDGVPTVGGIKQSTLAYWCELSHRSHVIAYAVDLTTETIYVTKPLFWQATSLIDGTETSKTIEFLPTTGKAIAANQLAEILTIAGAHSPSVPDTVYALTTSARYLKLFLEFRIDAFHYDSGTELDNEVFRSFLEVCSILLFWQGDEVPLPKEDKPKMFQLEHWALKWQPPYSTDITAYAAQAPITALLPMLIEKLRQYQQMVRDGAYYWSHKNITFLQLIHEMRLPPATDKKTLDEWGSKFDQIRPMIVDPFFMLLERARGSRAKVAAPNTTVKSKVANKSKRKAKSRKSAAKS